MVTVYYNGRTQIKISPVKRSTGQSPGKFHIQISQLFSPGGIMDTTNFSPKGYVTTSTVYLLPAKLI